MDDVEKIRDLLESIEPIAYRRPHLSVRAVSAAIDKALEVVSHQDANESNGVRTILSKCVPILVAAAVGDHSVIEDALMLLLRLHKADLVKTAFENERPADGMQKVCSYRQGVTVNHISIAISVLESWLASSEPDTRLLAIDLLGNLLGVSVSGDYNEGNKFVMTSALIGVSNEIVGIRNRVVELLSAEILQGGYVDQIAAVDATGKLGESRFGQPVNRESKVWSLVAKEQQVFLQVFSEVLKDPCRLGLAASIEQRLWSWWRAGPQSTTDLCLNLFAKLPASPEYAFWKAMNSDEIPVEHISAQDLASVSDRSDFYIEFCSRRDAIRPEYYRELINRLGATYTSCAEWIELFEGNLPSETQSMSWRSRFVFSCFAKYAPELAYDVVEAYENKGTRLDLRANLLFALRSIEPEVWREKLKSRTETDPAFAVSINAVPWISGLWGQSEINTREFELIRAALESREDRVRTVASSALGFVPNAGGHDPIAVLVEYVRRVPEDLSRWRALFSAIDTESRASNSIEPTALNVAIKLIADCGAKAQLERYSTEPGVTHFLRIVAKAHPDQLASLIETTWKQANDRSWSHGPPGILSVWHVEDAFRGLDTPSEKSAWAGILRHWILGAGPLADFAIDNFSEVCALTDKTTTQLIDSLVDGEVPEFERYLLMLLWHYKRDRNYITTIVSLLETLEGKDLGLFRKLKDSFKCDVRYRSSGRTIGDPSLVDAQSIEDLRSLLSRPRSPQIQSAIKDAITAVEEQIEDDRLEDEEIMRDR